MAVAEIHSGRLDLPAATVARLARQLSAEERARAERFAFARDRRRFVVRRARLREILATATGVCAERLAYTHNPYGKPALADGPHFSASHSGERWVVALSDHPVGVDIECHRPDLDWRDLSHAFAGSERAALDALDEADAIGGFFACWVRKEAFVKAIGLGLSHPLEAFAVSVTPDARLLAGADGWAIANLPVADGYAGALVIADDGSPVEIVRAPDREPISSAIS